MIGRALLSVLTATLILIGAVLFLAGFVLVPVVVLVAGYGVFRLLAPGEPR